MYSSQATEAIPSFRGLLRRTNRPRSDRVYPMCLTIASPNSEHFTSVAPSIRRAKS